MEALLLYYLTDIQSSISSCLMHFPKSYRDLNLFLKQYMTLAGPKLKTCYRFVGLIQLFLHLLNTSVISLILQ